MGRLLTVLFTCALLTTFTPHAQAVSTYASAPQNIVVTAVSGGLSMTWSDPADVASGILGFVIQYSNAGDENNWQQIHFGLTPIYSFTYLGLTESPRFIRIQARTTSGYGTWGHPWTKIYSSISKNRDSLNRITYESGFTPNTGDPAWANASNFFSRVKYRLDTTISGVSNYAEADFKKWVKGTDTTQVASVTTGDATLSNLKFPSLLSGHEIIVQANVADLNVYSDSSKVTKSNGATGVRGRLEIWPWDYGYQSSSLTDSINSGSGSLYDYNDTQNGNGSYGSFQVHDMSNAKPVFVWNNHGYGVTAEVAYGASTGTHPDYTFCNGGAQCPSPTSFKLQVFVNIAVTPLSDTTSPIVTRVDSKTVAKNTETITVRSNEEGKIYLVRNNITGVTATKIAQALNQDLAVVSNVVPNTTMTMSLTGAVDGTYNLYALDLFNNISTGVLATLTIDSTGPSLISLAVNSTGTAISITLSETPTISALDSNMFTISDGSAVSVTGVTINGVNVSLNLARAIIGGTTVYFAYSPSSGIAANRFKDAKGNETPLISNRTITNGSTAPVAITTSVPNSLYKGSAVTVSISAPIAGKITFFFGGKRIPGCISLPAAGSFPVTVACTFKPNISGAQKISAMFTPANVALAAAVTPAVERFILKRSNTR